MDELKEQIEAAYADRELLNDPAYVRAVRDTVDRLDRGQVRVAVKEGDRWIVNTWLKEAILLYFAITETVVMDVGPFQFHDKIPLKKNLKEQGVRVVPPGTVRYGAFLERGAVVMPGYVNIGAYVGAESMVDTWATVGSCAQVGKRVHLSGGAGLGGVLEPLSASPVIIEDGAFIGSRCVVVEGMVVGERAVLGAGTVLTASTPIIDVRHSDERIFKGHIPPGAVVVPGSRARTFPAGTYHMPCALIIGERTTKTDEKTSLNDVLREFAIEV